MTYDNLKGHNSGWKYSHPEFIPIQTYLPILLNSNSGAPSPIPGPTDPTPTLMPTPTRTPSPTATQEPDNCDPSYPTVCIPPPPPDLDCTDIPYRNFRVLPPDPHNFDGDGDGVGCET